MTRMNCPPGIDVLLIVISLVKVCQKSGVDTKCVAGPNNHSPIVVIPDS